MKVKTFSDILFEKAGFVRTETEYGEVFEGHGAMVKFIDEIKDFEVYGMDGMGDKEVTKFLGAIYRRCQEKGWLKFYANE